jgi:hypothetical protein
MRRHLVLMTVLVLGTLLVARVWARQPPKTTFQGYWMGIDPLDGGDSRRSFVRQGDGTYALAGRDSFLTLCDQTDRGLITFTDGVAFGRDRMRSNTLTIRCFNTSSSVVLRARYRLLADDVMTEVTTTLEGNPVSTIVFHRVGKEE